MRSIRALAAVTVSLAIVIASPARACTVFSIAGGGSVVFAGNEDGSAAGARVWFVAPADGRRGAVYLGFADGFRQAGMNDAGLCYDITACPRMALEPREGRTDPETNLIQEAMDRCATVDEVVDLFAAHNLRGFERVQAIFADAEGAAVVFDANHVTREKDGRLLATNFYVAAPELGRHPCARYEIASGMLADAGASVDDARRILSAVRQEGRSQTQYSHACEPREGRITLWRFHDFEQAVVLDLAAELRKGDREVELDELFPGRNFAAEAWRKKIERSLSRVFLRTLDEQGLEAAVAEYHETKIEHAEILNELASLGLGLMGDGRFAEAAAVFGLMTGDYPAFARGWEWLGNALVRSGDIEAAADAYRRCLEIAPGNRNARDVLDQVEAGG